MTRTTADQRAPDDKPDDVEPDPESVARTIALRRLEAAPQTRAQLDEAMRRRGVPDEIRERVLDRFGEVRLIDDAMFAQAWVDSRHTGRGLAKRALAFELRRRGVEPAVVDDALAGLSAEQEEERPDPSWRQDWRRRGLSIRRYEPVGWPECSRGRVIRPAWHSG